MRWNHANVPVSGGRPLSSFLCPNCAGDIPGIGISVKRDEGCTHRMPFRGRVPHGGYYKVEGGRIVEADAPAGHRRARGRVA